MSQSYIRRFAVVPAVLFGVWLTTRHLLPIFLPFLLAGLLALLSEPLVRVLCRRCHTPRWLGAGIGVLIALVMVILVTLVLGALLLRELGSLAGVVPDLESTAQSGIRLLRDWLGGMAGQAPTGIRTLLTHSLDGMFSGSSQLLDQISVRLLSFASGVLRALPDSALSLGTWIIASFMISAKLPSIQKTVPALVPKSWKERYLPALKQLKSSLGGWLLAQLKLTAITACVLAVGFLILRIPYGLLWAVLISLVDALPILGTGTVLIPWSVVCFLQGNSAQAIGLLATYVAAALLRSVLEPKLVGKQLGLDPLVTLIALYAGYQLWGLPGMLLAPVLAVTATQLFFLPKSQ